MYKLSIVFVTFVISLQMLAAPKSCNKYFLNGSWLKQAKVSTPISAIKVNAGFSLATGKKSELYFTKYFMKEAKINFLSKEELKPTTVHTYRYHQPDTQVSWFLPSSFTSKGGKKIRSHRGGGRDHIINLETALAVKGSGTNKLFSQSNHKNFDLNNFRRNGLMLLEDGLITYIIAKQMKSLSMNVIDIPDLVIADQSIQKIMNKDSKNKKSYIVQLHRNMSNARESMENTKQPSETHNHRKEGVYQLASDMLLFNIAHGAINPENMGYGGQIIDLGHVSFGYPLMSYNYRCTLCAGMEGGSADRTLIGILDHYFGDNLYSPSVNRSYSFKLKNTDLNLILEKSVSRLKGHESKPINITRQESSALRRLFKEQIVLWGHARPHMFYKDILTQELQALYSTEISKTNDYDPFANELINDDDWDNVELEREPEIDPDYELIGQPPEQVSEDQWLNDNNLFTGEDQTNPFSQSPQDMTTNNWNYMWPVNKAISYRFLWRVSAQKLYLSSSSYTRFKRMVENLIAPHSQSDFRIITHLLERIMTQNKLKRNDFKNIFQEFMPSNLLKHNIDEMITQSKTQQSIVKRSQELMEELAKPISFKPSQFRRLIQKVENEVSKKRAQYIKDQQQKAIDKVNQPNGLSDDLMLDGNN